MNLFDAADVRMMINRSVMPVRFARSCVLASLSLLFCLESPAQTDSALAFYPLGSGYRWQYTSRTESAIGNHNNGTFDDWIEKDTLLQNGKRYWIRNRGRYPTISDHFYERLDSVTANVYQIHKWPTDPERLVDSLRSTPGDTIRIWGAGYRHAAIVSDTVCGIITRTRRLVFNVTGTGASQYTSYGIGISHRMYWSLDYPSGASAWGADYSDLVYARIDGREYGTLLGSSERGIGVPEGSVLYQNYPNPFNPSTAIRISVTTRQLVTVSVFDLLGNDVATLLNGVTEPGTYTLEFNGKHLPSGVYMCRMVAGGASHTMKLVLLK